MTKFCPYCGRAKPEPETIKVSVTTNDVWETCEIQWAVTKKVGMFSASKLHWWAEGITAELPK